MKRWILLSLAFLCEAFLLRAEVWMPSVFSDNMVLQQNSKVKIWGWAKPFEEITVTTSWENKSYKVMTGNSMSWEVDVTTPEGSFTPYEITVEGWRKLTLKNVLIGEVWLCSGQSNMEWSPRNGILNGEQEIAKAKMLTDYSQKTFTFPPTNNSLIIPNWLHLPKILLKIFPNGAHKQ